MKPKISVVMSVYKEPEHYLRKSIESILNQTFKDFEFIIVLDNPNNKKTEEIIKEYQRKDKRIISLQNKKNVGLAASLNKGIKIAKGKYIARMDADDISLPNRLEDEIEFLEKNPDIGVVCSNRILIDEKGEIIGKSNFQEKDIENIKKTIFIKEPYPIVHPTVMGRLKIFKENLYDEKFRRSVDFELWLRLIKKGVKFGLIKKPLIYYRIPNQSYDERITKMKNYNKFSIKALLKNYKNYMFSAWFYLFFIKMLLLFLILRLPKTLLISLIKIKDRRR